MGDFLKDVCINDYADNKKIGSFSVKNDPTIKPYTQWAKSVLSIDYLFDIVIVSRISPLTGLSVGVSVEPNLSNATSLGPAVIDRNTIGINRTATG